MRRHLTLGLTVASLVLLNAATLPAQQAGQAANPQAWHGALPQGSTIEIKGVNGEIHASAASGSEVEVSAVMKGRKSNPADVRLDIVQHADGVTICAMYPSPDGRPNECQPGDAGRMNVRDNDVTVTFTVHVPAGVRFAGRTVNGNIEAENLDAPVAVQTVNGDVTFSTRAYGTASTVNGTVRGAMGSATWTDAVKIHTVNGSVSLDLPADTSTDLNAATVNGSIASDFPVTVSGRIGRQRLNGTIGSGGRSLQIETVNGSITLRKRD
ncbi:MAG TPA: DUF4097 family beta strand repeat-containing protein [Vicinamibacterales bacterium]|nr:DUF4097 family beta strand repeat-containing protein [Vicinamibacterales bacterium]